MIRRRRRTRGRGADLSSPYGARNYTFDELNACLNMHPQGDGEGTLIREVLRDEFSTAIIALTGPEHYSALHSLEATEVYHFYGGARRRMLLLYPDGRIEQPVLGADLGAGELPQLVVPKDVWQGSTSDGPWTLTGATMSPGYRSDQFKLANIEELLLKYPAAAQRILELAPHQ